MEEENPFLAFRCRQLWRLPLVWLLFLMFSSPSQAGGESVDFDEVLILLHVERVGSIEMPVLIRGEDVYLPVVETFNFLKIKTNPPEARGTVTGFFNQDANTFLIDPAGNRIVYQGKTVALQPEDIVITGSTMYLRSGYFGEVFGLMCRFDFRNLTVTLSSMQELPVVREMRLNQMRENARKIKKEFIADSTIGRYNPPFSFGSADWSVYNVVQQGKLNHTRVNLGLGAVLAGGELNGQLNYVSQAPFRERNQYYLWRYADNHNRLFRQVSVGKIVAQPVASVFNPILGVQVTNTPSNRGVSFGTYVYSNYTKPGWTVELYVNNSLVDYAKADGSGYFAFNIPLVYGNTDAMLRFYGLWGEEEVTRINFNIPFNFLPPGQMEYSISSGIVQDGQGSRYSQARLDYGISRKMTAGGGVEYLSSVASGQVMPFVTTSVSLQPNLLFSGEYTYGVRSKTRISYFSPSRFQLEVKYIKYKQAQEAVRYNFTSEAEATASVPFRLFNTRLNARVSAGQYFQGSTRLNNGRLMLTGSVRGVSLNFSTFFLSSAETLFGYTSLGASMLLPGRIILDSQVRYMHGQAMVSYGQLGLKRSVLRRGTLQTTFERDFSSRFNFFRLGFLYNFSFARTSTSSNFSPQGNSHFQSAGGGVLYDATLKRLQFSRNSQAGKGGITFAPFLDLNRNGKMDFNEPRVNGLNVQGTGGRVEKNLKDTVVSVWGLEPYTDYFAEFDANGFDNIAWRLRFKSLSVAVEPNQNKLVEVPVLVAGEVAGMIYLAEGKARKGQSRIKLHLYDGRDRLVASLLSEDDGYFSYMGLPPGAYKARIDEAQLRNLNMKVVPAEERFLIHNTPEGDYADHLEFTIEYGPAEPLVAEEIIRSALLDTEAGQAETPADKPVFDAYTVQLLVTAQKLSPSHPAFAELKDVEERQKDGMYTYTVGRFQSEPEAIAFHNELTERGYTGTAIVPADSGAHLDARAPEVPAENFDRAPVSGVVAYKVQVLTSRKKLGSRHRLLRSLEDVQVYYHQGQYKYTWGEYTSIEPAIILENELRDRGFKDAFVVKFKDNQRVMPDGLDLPVSGKAAHTRTGGLVFRVQVAATHYKTSPNHPMFTSLPGVAMYYHEGMYKYTVGEVSTIAEAQALRNNLRLKGFTGAFIVPFYQGERLPVEIMPSTTRKMFTNKSTGLIFSIQLVTSRKPLALNHDMFLGLSNVRMYYHNGLYKYVWGEAATHREVKRLETRLLEKGFVNLQVVPFFRR